MSNKMEKKHCRFKEGMTIRYSAETHIDPNNRYLFYILKVIECDEKDRGQGFKLCLDCAGRIGLTLCVSPDSGDFLQTARRCIGARNLYKRVYIKGENVTDQSLQKKHLEDKETSSKTR